MRRRSASAEGKPGFGDIADALELALHFGVLGFQDFLIGIFRDVDGAEQSITARANGLGSRK